MDYIAKRILLRIQSAATGRYSRAPHTAVIQTELQRSPTPESFITEHRTLQLFRQSYSDHQLQSPSPQSTALCSYSDRATAITNSRVLHHRAPHTAVIQTELHRSPPPESFVTEPAIWTKSNRSNRLTN